MGPECNSESEAGRTIGYGGKNGGEFGTGKNGRDCPGRRKGEADEQQGSEAISDAGRKAADCIFTGSI